MIFFVNPKIIEFSDERIVLKIRLNWRTKNHLKSMYLGVLTVGADIASGFHAFHFSKKSEKRISLAFKSLKGEFLSRAESHVYFISQAGSDVESMISESEKSGERITKNILLHAVTGYPNEINEVAKFEMGLSIKVKN